ncbi:MAG: hypothetical protein COU46_00080 [Candidatus Niyogibacteria bacterium CG10_big_fil_rev_8_21_14_0_10_42_19]|uniref:Penicillin-binding protein 2 n=1 Tax=Candidatus Niyogibacteria bacterium CG10_big_fil_rev_8_21_14_0_10_42_19 TaxID=1974725 RepID=A0A2H0TIR2_9BACT|nr:MAG: hypothetical protein COU46_00080 [Candidatus Niyogibacteria bacterium CG10_big_fil_rev_8_21_14_0_10_42_19]
MFPRHRKKYKNKEISPDEIFLDSRNIPEFDVESMEGHLEVLLSGRVAFTVYAAYFILAVIFISQLFNLQVVKAGHFRERAYLNRLELRSLIPERGLILDRNGVELAWNEPTFQVVINPDGDNEAVVADNVRWEEAEALLKDMPDLPLRIEPVPVRRYTSLGGFAHLLGYVGYPEDQSYLEYELEEGSKIRLYPRIKIGKTGLEQKFEKKLSGILGAHIAEVNSKGKIVSESKKKDPEPGAPLQLTIDSGMQSVLYNSISGVVNDKGFRGGAGVVLDVKTGDVLAMTSFPELNSNDFSKGISSEEFSKILNDKKNPFFFRALEGLYSPGSVIKPLIALAALNEGVIKPEKQIFSAGSISLPNPYFPGQASVFPDWKAHGWVDLRRALAVSSNVFFYEIGGGFQDQPGLGADRIRMYEEAFGLGRVTGVGLSEASGFIPSPEWKKENVKNDPIWRIGDTYNFSIGQGATQVTPIQMARVIAAIAADGKILKLNIIDGSRSYIENEIDIDAEYFNVVKEGLRMAVAEGTAQALSGLKVKVAGKTGTAEIGDGRVNSWFIGFLPYENPTIAVAVVLESGDIHNLIGAPFASRQFVEWTIANRPEMVGL